MRKADPALSALGPGWCQIWCQNRAIFPVFSVFTGFITFAVNNLPIFQFHGTEEVVGSIPTRSTIFNYLQNLRVSVWCHLVSKHYNLFQFHETRSSVIPTRSATSQLLADTPFFNLVSFWRDCFRCMEEVVGAIPIRSSIF